MGKGLTVIFPIRKQDGSWARSNKEKTNPFADYLATVFTPNNKNNNNNEDDGEKVKCALLPC
jgi:hypothetical protein